MQKEIPPRYDGIEEEERSQEVLDEGYSDQPKPEDGAAELQAKEREYIRKEMPPAYGDIGEEERGQEVLDQGYSDQPDGFSPTGIHAATGQPLLPPVSATQVADAAFRKPPPAELHEVRKVIRPDLDWNDLSQTGWGVILSDKADPSLAESLSELLEFRESKAGWMFKKLSYQPGESFRQFLARRGVGPGVVDPEIVPYYLLIVGDPADIPFSFQYQLSASYGVGRLYFDDLGDYSRYASNVVRAETRGVSLPRVASLFGVERDATTYRTTCELIAPLVERLICRTEDWRIRTWIRKDATKDRLRALLGGMETPGLLVAASHGVVYDREDPRQRERQGALLCQDWPGPPEKETPLVSDDLFYAEDVSPEADLRGLFAFLFACYSAGTPEESDFVHENGPRLIAPRNFVARLPQRLLRQGALGVIGHVDRAWTCTFSWTEKGGQVETPATVLQQLLSGHRAGHAVSYFGHRYAELATQLTDVWEKIRKGKPNFDDDFLAWLWTAHNDARNMILLGDPAARRVERE